MKITRKLLSLALALVMTLALCVSALADETYTITINNSASGHIYEAYQIFAGDLYDPSAGAEEEETTNTQTKILSNIVWGSGVSEEGKTALGNAAEKANSLNEANVKSFAKEVADYLTAPTASGEQTDGKYIISGLAAGYYLVKDKEPNNSLSGKDDFYTAYIMKVVGNVEATPKGDKPTLEKQIKADNGPWKDDASGFQLGSTISFRLIASVPDVSNYPNGYTYTITDTMTVGLTSNVKTANDITIEIDNDSNAPLAQTYYTVTPTATGFTLSIDIKKAIEDGILEKGDLLYINYTAILNENAWFYGDRPNKNTASLEYSNNPNGNGTGKTPEDTVYAWTFPIAITKVDGKTSAQIEHAKFVLSRKADLNIADLQCDENGVPTVTTDLIALSTAHGSKGTYDVATATDLADNAEITYVIDAGSVTIAGLGEHTYYLYETKAPNGYNLLAAPVKIEVNCTYQFNAISGNTVYPSLTVDGKALDSLHIDIVNNSGATLPETGGIGTTIFYAAGALLVVGAGVLLVTKKRMNKSED